MLCTKHGHWTFNDRPQKLNVGSQKFNDRPQTLNVGPQTKNLNLGLMDLNLINSFVKIMGKKIGPWILNNMDLERWSLENQDL